MEYWAKGLREIKKGCWNPRNTNASISYDWHNIISYSTADEDLLASQHDIILSVKSLNKN